MLAGAAGAASTTPKTGAASKTSAAGSCADPLVHDTYDGFHVGVPAGWHLSTGSGLIVVQKSFSSATQGVIESAYLAKRQTPAMYLAATLKTLAMKAKANNNLISYKLTSPTAATITGRSGKTVFAGAASVALIHTKAAHGTRLGVVSIYWAPPKDLPALRPKLAAIGGCYGLEPGALFQLHQDSGFTYALPSGWKVASEGANNLFLNDGKDGSANFLIEGPFPTSSGIKNASSLFQASLNDLGIKLTHVLLSSLSPEVKVTGGGVEQQLVIQFEGSLGTERIQALARVLSETRSGALTGLLRIAVAKNALWNSLTGPLLFTTYGIQHDFTQDKTQILQTQQQLAGFGQQVNGYTQALGGTDIAENPGTGARFEAPYNAYSQSGPSGPGYYTSAHGKLTKLEVVTQ